MNDKSQHTLSSIFADENLCACVNKLACIAFLEVKSFVTAKLEYIKRCEGLVGGLPVRDLFSFRLRRTLTP